MLITSSTIARVRRSTVAELHRYVDEAGNVFSMTIDDAKARGLKEYKKPAASAVEAPAEKAVEKPPANKAR